MTKQQILIQVRSVSNYIGSMLDDDSVRITDECADLLIDIRDKLDGITAPEHLF